MKREIAMQRERERLCLRTVSFGLRGVLDLDFLDSIGLSLFESMEISIEDIEEL
jgi:hypothetical protein